MTSNREKTLPEVLGEYARQNAARFHMPGHKGRGIPMAESLSAWDVTELPTTDNLHHPSAAIDKTQREYAKVYGARDCFLLVNGATAGVLAMLLSPGEGRRILLIGACHRSAISGVALAGHDIRLLAPQDGLFPSAAQLDAALCAEPADAVFIVSPDYYGRCADLRSLSAVAHRHGALFLLDAAHGAHFPFSAQLPELCADCVDLFCVSAHKTLNAFTQSALLFSGKCCPLEKERLQQMLSLVQTSSPSYPLMASLDWALHASRGWDEHIARIRIQQKRLSVANGIQVQTADNQPVTGVFALDPTRLVIRVRERGLSGFEAYDALYAMGVTAEMADRDSVVFITTPQDPDEWYDRLYKAVCTLPYGICIPESTPVQMPRCERVRSVRSAVLSPSESLPLRSAFNRIACAAIGPYPPGTPVLLPGERISAEMIESVCAALAEGCIFFGLEEDNHIRVVR